MEADSRIRLVVVDDDRLYLEALKASLEHRGMVVSTFSGGEALLQSLEVAARADVAVLDWIMPRMGGLTLMTRLRKAGARVPVVFLTGQPQIEYERAAFQAGALDFIAKTRGMEILFRRLTQIARRHREASASPPLPALRLGALVLRPGTLRAEWHGRDAGLTTTEFKIVALLAARPAEFATFREIYNTVHYVGFLSGHATTGVMTNVRAIIKRIRRKFLDVDPAFGEIVSHAGVGYAWRKPAAAGAGGQVQPDLQDPS